MTDLTNHTDPEANKGFSLPEDYFGHASARILQRVACVEELADYPILQKINKEKVFDVPVEYFKQSAMGLELLPYPHLQGITKSEGFVCPENYFTEQADAITAQVHESVLNRLAKEQNFAVPSAYFDKNGALLTKRLLVPESGRVVLLNRYRYAVAAAAVLVISLGWWFNKHDNRPSNDDGCGTLACIEKRELLKSKQIENLDDDDLLELVNPDQLQKNLNSTKTIKNVQTHDSMNFSEMEDLPEEI